MNNIAIGNFLLKIIESQSALRKGWHLPSANAKVTAKALKRQASAYHAGAVAQAYFS